MIYRLPIKQNKCSDVLVIDSAIMNIFENDYDEKSNIFSSHKQMKTAVLLELNLSNQSNILSKILIKLLELGIKRIQVKNWVLPETINDSDCQYLKLEIHNHNLQSFEFLNWSITEAQLKFVNTIVEL